MATTTKAVAAPRLLLRVAVVDMVAAGTAVAAVVTVARPSLRAEAVVANAATATVAAEVLLQCPLAAASMVTATVAAR